MGIYLFCVHLVLATVGWSYLLRCFGICTCHLSCYKCLGSFKRIYEEFGVFRRQFWGFQCLFSYVRFVRHNQQCTVLGLKILTFSKKWCVWINGGSQSSERLSKDAFRDLFWVFAPEALVKVGKEIEIEYVHKGSNFGLLIDGIEIQNKNLK